MLSQPGMQNGQYGRDTKTNTSAKLKWRQEATTPSLSPISYRTAQIGCLKHHSVYTSKLKLVILVAGHVFFSTSQKNSSKELISIEATFIQLEVVIVLWYTCIIQETLFLKFNYQNTTILFLNFNNQNTTEQNRCMCCNSLYKLKLDMM